MKEYTRSGYNYGQERTCKNCFKPVYWEYGGSTGSDMWLHSYNRWVGDNGFWCTKDSQYGSESMSKRVADGGDAPN